MRPVLARFLLQFLRRNRLHLDGLGGNTSDDVEWFHVLRSYPHGPNHNLLTDVPPARYPGGMRFPRLRAVFRLRVACQTLLIEVERAGKRIVMGLGGNALMRD